MNDGRVDDRLKQLGLWSFFHKHLIVELFTTLRDQLAAINKPTTRIAGPAASS